ncbi:MAG: DNA-3-methyladenine glycosylase [Ferruginibacter sp.]|nr:DNA-3-methyladenine glycosylase [Ferruginibacter sp.]
MKGKKISLSFYNRTNVLRIAYELLGKVLLSSFDNNITAGRIVEAEGYKSVNDSASHAYGGRRTARNEDMYGRPGTSYVYVCYGVHNMMNVVTNKRGIPDAILIRAVEPLVGLDIMLKRAGKKDGDVSVSSGPGNVSRALGISKGNSGLSLLGNLLYILDDGFSIADNRIGISKRIGVEGAGYPDADYPYRFYIKGNAYVSGYPKK